MRTLAGRSSLHNPNNKSLSKNPGGQSFGWVPVAAIYNLIMQLRVDASMPKFESFRHISSKTCERDMISCEPVKWFAFLLLMDSLIRPQICSYSGYYPRGEPSLAWSSQHISIISRAPGMPSVDPPSRMQQEATRIQSSVRKHGPSLVGFLDFADIF